jgi:hypothetical protein
MTIMDGNRRGIAIGIAKWAHLSRDGGGFHRPRCQPGETDQIVSQILQT